MERNKSRAISVLILFMLLLVFANILYSEIHPKYYTKMQNNAPEVYQITVQNVDKEWCLFSCRKRTIKIDAIVTKVYRTQTNMIEQKSILIQYTLVKNPKHWVGPRPLPLLQKNQTYPAFLRFSRLSGNKKPVFVPVARGYSFQALIPLKKSVRPKSNPS